MTGLIAVFATLLILRWLSPRDRNDPVMPPCRVPLGDGAAYGPMPLTRTSAWNNLIIGETVGSPRQGRFARRFVRHER